MTAVIGRAAAAQRVPRQGKGGVALPPTLPGRPRTLRQPGQSGAVEPQLHQQYGFCHTGDSATQQTYAYDFGHDFGENIACMRAGTVVSFTDTFADSNEDNPNTIVIRHATIDPEHDDFGNGPVQTYSRYLHLATNGVTTAPRFAGGGTIVGTAVAQGDLIAKAGDTGQSFHNHLHIDIVPDDGTGNPSDDFAIPFVFEDVGGDGVPKSLTWYRSGTPDGRWAAG